MTIQLHTLSNGFRIATERMPSLESTCVGVWVTAGARDERADQNGIAHFLEHMAFKGTARRSSLQIAEAIEDVGGYINAYTSRETTAYYARVLANDVPLAMDVIADILLNPVFDPEEIELERGVILQEIGQAQDTPDDVIFDWLQERAYPEQALGRSILGPEENVGAFQRSDFADFVNSHYGPERMILAAAGAVDHEAIVAEAERLFGGMTPGRAGRLEPARFVGGETRVEKDLEQAHFALAFESPNYLDPEIYTAQIYAAAMGGGMSSRLFQEIREKRGLCYSIFAQAGGYVDSGMTTIYAGTSEKRLGDLIDLTLEEMKRAAWDMSAQEVARARTQMKAGLLMGLESPSSRAERLARMLQVWGRIPDLSEVVKRIDAVTTGDVKSFGRKIVSRAPLALALYGPVGAAPALDSIQARRVG